ncbi:MAG TPA: serine/threonine-protein kinase [Geodermatophilus sp.]|nr:serine/threonine-protein kinase [Geodermatophilus sp.]
MATTEPGNLVAGRYRLLSCIGGGGMGAVWLARDERLGRQVAVKQVLPPGNATPAEVDQQRQRALREGRIAARLSNLHAISVYDVALEAGQPWLVMEYLPSRSLAAVLQDDGLLRVDEVAQIGAQVADALAATHAAGIVHRDVKPANILIGEGPDVEGLVKITDFGISHARGDVSLTQTGQITGTPAFLAPEVAQGAEVSEASDVFSLGATLYTCLEGEPPFGMDDNALRLLHRVAGGQMRPPRRAGWLTGPLTRMLAADPAARPSMTEVRDELARLAAGPDGDPTTVLLARTVLRPAPGRARTLTLGPAAAGAATPPADFAPTAAPGAPGRGAAASRPARVVGTRRRRPPLAVAVLLLAALAGLGAFWALAGGNDPGTVAGPTATTPADRTEPPAPPPAEDTPAEEAPATEEAPPPPQDSPTAAEDGGNSLGAREVQDALREYHDLLPGNAEAAYERTGPTLREVIGPADYRAFWEQFREVTISEIDAEEGTGVATAELEFRWPDGSRQRELHRFTLVVGDDGDLLVDVDQTVQVLEQR